MRVIGKIDWIGEYSKNNKGIDFGYILDNNNNKIIFNISDIRGDNDIKIGYYVLYDLQERKNGKKNAINIEELSVNTLVNEISLESTSQYEICKMLINNHDILDYHKYDKIIDFSDKHQYFLPESVYKQILKKISLQVILDNEEIKKSMLLEDILTIIKNSLTEHRNNNYYKILEPLITKINGKMHNQEYLKIPIKYYEECGDLFNNLLGEYQTDILCFLLEKESNIKFVKKKLNDVNVLKNIDLNRILNKSNEQNKNILGLIDLQLIFENRNILRKIQIQNIVFIMEATNKDIIYKCCNNIVDYLIDKFKNFHVISSYYMKIPISFYTQSNELFNLLKHEMKSSLLCECIKKGVYEEFVKDKLSNSKELLNEIEHNLKIIRLNKEKYYNLKIWNVFHDKFKVDVLVNNTNIALYTDEDISTIINYAVSNGLNDIYANILGIKFLKQYNLIQYIDKYKQVELFFSNKVLWTELSRDAMIYSIYKMLKENRDYTFLRHSNISGIMVNDNILYAICLLIFAKDSSDEEKKKRFIEAHNLIQDYVIERAWDLDKEIDLDVLFQKCQAFEQKKKKYNLSSFCKNKKHEYCDCRDWHPDTTKEDLINGGVELIKRGKIIGYCRKKGAIMENSYMVHKMHSCPKIEGDLDRPWQKWSLKELLAYCEITPEQIEGLKKPIEYVNRMAGWINRLNEIRDRLKCSKCNTPLISNKKYAKNLAKFTSTVFNCPEEGIKHDKNIYFNQCWSCHKIIDSRESSIKVEGYYLCIHCGAGPQESQIYRPGTICPKCGSKKIHKLYDKFYRCSNCNHEINVRKY